MVTPIDRRRRERTRPPSGASAFAGALFLRRLAPKRPEAPQYTAEQKERGYYGNRRIEMLPFLPPSTRTLLDVGCGRGAFGATVRRVLGTKVWGIEIDPRAARLAAVRLDRVIEADLHSAFAQLPAARFDCITFNDILEHLTDPYPVVEAVRRLLTPIGVVVASLPNVRHFPVVWKLLWRGRWDYADCGVLDRTHLRFFTARSIRVLFEECGYRVRQLAGINATTTGLARWATLLAPPMLDDMQYMQFAVVAEPRR